VFKLNKIKLKKIRIRRDKGITFAAAKG